MNVDLNSPIEVNLEPAKTVFEVGKNGIYVEDVHPFWDIEAKVNDIIGTKSATEEPVMLLSEIHVEKSGEWNLVNGSEVLHDDGSIVFIFHDESGSNNERL